MCDTERMPAVANDTFAAESDLSTQSAARSAKEALGAEGLNVYGAMTALQHVGDPAEVGAAAAFLASSDNSFMTASEVAVDGGLAQL
jgi:NAD(P)-dependent dehydrogenase (short-subunit alcohol dehydrogenase family)